MDVMKKLEKSFTLNHKTSYAKMQKAYWIQKHNSTSQSSLFLCGKIIMAFFIFLLSNSIWFSLIKYKSCSLKKKKKYSLKPSWILHPNFKLGHNEFIPIYMYLFLKPMWILDTR